MFIFTLINPNNFVLLSIQVGITSCLSQSGQDWASGTSIKLLHPFRGLPSGRDSQALGKLGADLGHLSRGTNCWSVKWFSAGLMQREEDRNGSRNSEGFIRPFPSVAHILTGTHWLRPHQTQWTKIFHTTQGVMNRTFLSPRKSTERVIDHLIHKMGITV